MRDIMDLCVRCCHHLICEHLGHVRQIFISDGSGLTMKKHRHRGRSQLIEWDQVI